MSAMVGAHLKQLPDHKSGLSVYGCLQLVMLFIGSAGFMLLSCLAYSSNLKIQVTYSSETSDDFQWTTQCYIPEQ
jgi:hypothetical protein